MVTKPTIGMKKLSKHMDRRGLNQAKMGELLEVTQETISRYLSGASRPTPRVALRLEVATRGRIKMGDWWSDVKDAEAEKAAIARPAA